MSATEPLSSKRVVVVVPTFNERENLTPLLEVLSGLGYGVLVVDDASPDGTGEVAERLAERLAGVEVLHREAREGLGPAYTAGFRRVLAGPVDVVCGMDADFSHDPEDLPRMIEPVTRGEADMVIGSRYVAGGRVPDWPLRRRLLSRGANLYVRVTLGTPLRDSTSGFRVFSARALGRLDFATCRAVGYVYLTEMAWRAVRRGLRVVELPITFRDRRHGKSKMGGRTIYEAMSLVTRWGLRRLVASDGRRL